MVSKLRLVLAGEPDSDRPLPKLTNEQVTAAVIRILQRHYRNIRRKRLRLAGRAACILVSFAAGVALGPWLRR